MRVRPPRAAGPEGAPGSGTGVLVEVAADTAVGRETPGGSRLVANGLGFAAGVGLLFLFPDLPPLSPLLGLVLATAAASLRWRRLMPGAFAALGLAWAQIQACETLCHGFPEGLARKPLTVVGTIVSLPADRPNARRFVFRIASARLGPKPVAFTGAVRLSWYRNPPALVAGERWQLRVVLKPPHGFADPGALDYERWLFVRRIKATGYVRESVENRRLSPGFDPISRLRQGLREHLGAVLGHSPALGLVEALVLGDRSALSSQQWAVLSRTGTSHLVAISGLHVGLVSALVFFLVRWGWSRSSRLTLALAAPRAAAIAAAIGALTYSALAGFAVSTQRAVIMLSVVLGAVLFSRTLRPATGLVAALVGVLLLDPFAVLSYGFWLSFAAVGVLLYSLGRRLAAQRWWSRWGRAQWAVALGLLPLLLLLFGRASLIAPLVNLIAVPLFSLLVLPVVLVTSLLSLVPGLELPLILTARALAWAFGLLQAIAGLDWAAVAIAGRPGWVWASGFAGALLLLAPRGLPGRWLGVVLLLPLPLVRPATPIPGEAEFTLLDVGQGLSAVVRTRHHTFVYDTGPSFPSGFNTGSAVLLPFLRQAGVDRIDTLVLSHGDRDHVGGFAGIKGLIPIDRVLSGEPARVPAAHARPCYAGQKWVWDGVRFAVLYPPPGLSGRGNDSSCVIRIGTAGARLLLTGDIGGDVEEELARDKGSGIKSTVLVAAHHGSASSTTDDFLAAVAPRYVLYASGYLDRFGFPTKAVGERVARRGAADMDTAKAGAISFVLGPDGLDGPFGYRREHRHLWTR
jgi:competence protein ComEC